MSDLSENPCLNPPHDPLLDAVVFLARFFGQAVDPAHVTAGVPLAAGQLGRAQLEECAARAGLTLSPARVEPARKTQGSTIIMWIGRLTRFGTSPEKTSHK